jgi:uncharacterized membrane protein SirB2
MLIEHYTELRALHIGCVVASATLFALRALSRLAGALWPLARPARVASWVIDSALLLAGALLWAALQLHPLQQPWLGTKLLLLPVYVALGTMALRRARTPAARLGWTLAALACLALMATVARAHDPAGVFFWRIGWWV